MCPRQESNLQLLLRTESLYPFNYEGNYWEARPLSVLNQTQFPGYFGFIESNCPIPVYDNYRDSHLAGQRDHFLPFFKIAGYIVFGVSYIILVKKIFRVMTKMARWCWIYFYFFHIFYKTHAIAGQVTFNKPILSHLPKKENNDIFYKCGISLVAEWVLPKD